jgi:hypothetical protein
MTRSAGVVAEEIKWEYARLPERGRGRSLVDEIDDQLQSLKSRLRVSPDADVEANLKFIEGLRPILAAIAISEKGEVDVRPILEVNWPLVEHLANELITRRRIEGEDLEKILNDWRPHLRDSDSTPS